LRKRLFFVFLLLASVSFAAEAPISLETQINASNRILRGRVTHVSSYPGTNEFGDHLIYSDVSLQTEEALKGDRSNLVVRVEGGTVNGLTLVVTDTPKFREGEEVLVFLKCRPLLNVLPTGLEYKYTIGPGGYLQTGVSYYEIRRQILQIVKAQEKSK
jgi:hypothetical protein